MRIKDLSLSMAREGFDAYLVTREPNILYFAGTTSGGVLILSQSIEPILLVPSLNLSIAEDQADGCEVRPYKSWDLLKQTAQILGDFKPRRIGFDELSLSQFNTLKGMMGSSELKEEQELVWAMRRVKDSREQSLMRKAGELSDLGMQAVQDCLKDGIREHEVAAEASHSMMMEGAEGHSFPLIIASGPRTAYPHAGVTDRKIRRGDLVKIDMGAAYRGYRSDITRTFIVGSPTEKQKAIYESVLEANLAALPEIRDGAAGVDVDRVAREILEKAGYVDEFIHGLGHGVGLEIHEPPSLGKRSEDVLQVGNVVSNEPGVYIKGYGGVRIEDTVLVTSSGPDRLTKFDVDFDAMRV